MGQGRSGGAIVIGTVRLIGVAGIRAVSTVDRWFGPAADRRAVAIVLGDNGAGPATGEARGSEASS